MRLRDNLLFALLLLFASLAQATNYVGITIAASNPITVSCTASRTAGVAPYSVFFDCSASTAASLTSLPIHELQYTFDFGDTAAPSATWGYGANTTLLKNAQVGGPWGAHVYETAGTYTGTVTVQYGATTNSANLSTITVTDPETVFAGNKTACVSTSGTFTDCPAGADQHTTSSRNTAIGYINAGSTVKRLLIRCGETVTDTGAGTALTQAGPGIIGTYGSSCGKGTIAASTASGQNGILRGSQADWRVVDLILNGGGGSNDSYGLTISGANTTALRVDATGTSVGFWPTGDNNFIVDSTYANSTGLIGNIGIYSGVASTPGSAVMGNSVEFSNACHGIRMGYLNGAVIGYNTVGQVTATQTCGGGETLKIFAPIWGTTPDFTQNVDIISNSIRGTGGIAPQNPGNDERLKNIIVERNWINHVDGNFQGLYMSAVTVTVRNNLCDMTGGGNVHACFQVIKQGSEPTPDGFNFYNNTGYSGDAGGSDFTVIQIGKSPDVSPVNVTIKNNLGYAPNAGSPTLFTSVATQDPTASTNTCNTKGCTTNMKTSPSFTTSPPVVIGDYKPTTATPQGVTGGSVPVWSDFYGASEPATRVIGAVNN